MWSAHKLEFLVMSEQAHRGFVVVGIPADQFQKLKAEYPDRQWSGQDPKVNEAIRDGVTKEEKGQIAVEVRLSRHAKIQLEFKTPGPRYVDEEKEEPSFEMNGKKFWVYPP